MSNGFNFKDINKFEKLNMINLYIFTYEREDEGREKYPLHVSKNNYDKKINLLYIEK